MSLLDRHALPILLAASACAAPSPGTPTSAEAFRVVAPTLTTTEPFVRTLTTRMTAGPFPHGSTVALVVNSGTAAASPCPPSGAFCVPLAAPYTFTAFQPVRTSRRLTFDVVVPSSSKVGLAWIGRDAHGRWHTGPVQTFSTVSDADRDGDGVKDRAEVSRGLDYRNPDTDGGGRSDGYELHAGSNPLVASDDYVERCDNLEDDDEDGLLDCEDGDCVNAANCQETRAPTGRDDDGDGWVDCDDDDCWGNGCAYAETTLVEAMLQHEQGERGYTGNPGCSGVGVPLYRDAYRLRDARGLLAVHSAAGAVQSSCTWHFSDLFVGYSSGYFPGFAVGGSLGAGCDPAQVGHAVPGPLVRDAWNPGLIRAGAWHIGLPRAGTYGVIHPGAFRWLRTEGGTAIRETHSFSYYCTEMIRTTTALGHVTGLEPARNPVP